MMCSVAYTVFAICKKICYNKHTYTNILMKVHRESTSHIQHVLTGFVLASMYFVYMFVLLPNM